MGYGNFEELLETSDEGIKKSRKKLKRLYKLLQDGYNLKAMEKLREIDIILLNSQSEYNEKKDGIFIDGKSKIKPDWMHNS